MTRSTPDPLRPSTPPTGPNPQSSGVVLDPRLFSEGDDDIGSLTNTPLDAGSLLGAGAAAVGGLGASFFNATGPQDNYVAPAGARRVSTDQQGNPVFQLTDEGGNLIQWAIDQAGEIFGLANLGPANPPLIAPPPPDNRLTYVAPSGATRTGDDSSGNPLFSLVDEGGDLITWGINRLGEAFGITNKGPAAAAGGRTSGGTTAGASSGLAGTGAGSSAPGSLFGGGGLDAGTDLGNLLSNVLGGNNAPSGGLNLSPVTVNAPTTTTTLVSDTSNRGTSTTNTTINSTVNDTSLFNTFANTLTSLFRSGPPLQAAANAQPFNDATQTRGMVSPSMFPAGQLTDWGRSGQESTSPTVAKVTGANPAAAPGGNALSEKWIMIGAVATVILLVVFLLRKK